MRLEPYPASPAFADTLTAEATLECRAEGFRLEYCFSGAGVDSLLLAPPSSTPLRRDELWQHTCVEVFLAVANSTRYYEFNGSPSGDWALYRFDDYRQGMQPQPVTAPPCLLAREHQHDKLQHDTLRLVWWLPVFSEDTIERASITAILHCEQPPGLPVYWALRHAGTKPDFHLRESFILDLPIAP